MLSLCRSAAFRRLGRSAVVTRLGGVVSASSAKRGLAYHVVKNEKDLESRLNVEDKLVVVDWSAEWCGPCQVMGPFVKHLADNYPSVDFLNVDVDEVPDAASDAGITSVPTFVFWRNNEKLDEFSGANMDGLEQLVVQLDKKD